VPLGYRKFSPPPFFGRSPGLLSRTQTCHPPFLSFFSFRPCLANFFFTHLSMSYFSSVPYFRPGKAKLVRFFFFLVPMFTTRLIFSFGRRFPPLLYHVPVFRGCLIFLFSSMVVIPSLSASGVGWFWTVSPSSHQSPFWIQTLFQQHGLMLRWNYFLRPTVSPVLVPLCLVSSLFFLCSPPVSSSWAGGRTLHRGNVVPHINFWSGPYVFVPRRMVSMTVG